MILRLWRTTQGMTLEAAARGLGLGGRNPGRTLQRIETGEARAEADLVAAIERLTGGAVTPVDMQATRLAWLKAQGRDRAFPVSLADPIPVPTE